MLGHTLLRYTVIMKTLSRKKVASYVEPPDSISLVQLQGNFRGSPAPRLIRASFTLLQCASCRKRAKGSMKFCRMRPERPIAGMGFLGTPITQLGEH